MNYYSQMLPEQKFFPNFAVYNVRYVALNLKAFNKLKNK